MPQRAKLSRTRVTVQILIHLVLVGHVLAYYLLDWRALGALDFQGFFRYFLGEGLLTAGALLAVIVYGSALLFGRLFCSWGCHFGATQDLAAWLLRKVGWRPTLVRTRVLHWSPFIVLVVAFILPLLRREEEPLAGEAGRGGWSLGVDLAAVAPWDTLPGWGLSIATFLVCGAGLLLFLGTRGFCRFVCPYGAVFRITDGVAPLRVRRIGACSASTVSLGGCGSTLPGAPAGPAAPIAVLGCGGRAGAPPCTAACPTAIDVHDETLRLGKVASMDCVRCNLCIEACPSGALAHVSARRARRLLKEREHPIVAPGPAIARRYTLPLAGEVLILAMASATYWVADGVYGGHFLAASLALAEGSLVWSLLAAALGRERRESLGLPLREAARAERDGAIRRRGRWTLAGAGAALLVTASWIPLGEAAAFKVLRWRGVALESRAMASAGLPADSAVGPADAARGDLRESARLYRAALEHLPADKGTRKLLIRTLVRLGDAGAGEEARALVALDPEDARAAQILEWVRKRGLLGKKGAASP